MESGGDEIFYSPSDLRNENWWENVPILIAEVRRGHLGCKILHHHLTPYPEITSFRYPEFFLKISWIFARAKTKAPEWTALPLFLNTGFLIEIVIPNTIQFSSKAGFICFERSNILLWIELNNTQKTAYKRLKRIWAIHKIN